MPATGCVVRRAPPSWTITVVLAAFWLVSGPRTPDLAAQMHRVGVERLLDAAPPCLP